MPLIRQLLLFVIDVTIRVMLILAIMANWLAWIVDVEGAFLQGRFQNGELIFMKIPNGFQKFYPSYVMLKLLRVHYMDWHNLRSSSGVSAKWQWMQ
jgi:hypothetical protein